MRSPELNRHSLPAASATRSPEDLARTMIRSAGARITAARARVLAELLRCGEALTHTDLQKRVGLGSESIDRVTLYRVLDWLAESGLAHRVAGPDRIFRFSVHATEVPHGHFRCVECDRMYCLVELEQLGLVVRDALPAGFVATRVELTVSGRCASCTREH